MGLFDALTGKIWRFNSINIPIDNSIASRIKELDESSEKLLIVLAFGISQQMISQIFNPDVGILRKSLDSLTANKLEQIYHTLMDYSMCLLIKLPLPETNSDTEDTHISCLAKVLLSEDHKIKADILAYTKSDSGVMGLYENICSILGHQPNSKETILFFGSFMEIYKNSVSKLTNAIFEN
jgi:hypothetical protein